MNQAERALLVKSLRGAYRLETKFPALPEWFAGQDTESIRRTNTRVVARQRRRGYNIRPGFGASARLTSARAQLGPSGTGANRSRGTLQRIRDEGRAGHSGGYTMDNSTMEAGSSAYTPTPTAPNHRRRSNNAQQDFSVRSVVKPNPYRRAWRPRFPAAR